MRVQESPGAIGAMPQARHHITFSVEVAGVAAALKLIGSKAGKLGFGPHPVPTGAIIAGFTDPEANLVG
jgi:predicted enzyme related to lactoylglutathione lyase